MNDCGCSNVNLHMVRTHPAASLYPLVHLVGEGFAADVAAAALSGVKAAFLQHDLALADHHQWSSTHLRALKDVILHSLEEKVYEGLVFNRVWDSCTEQKFQKHKLISCPCSPLFAKCCPLWELFVF